VVCHRIDPVADGVATGCVCDWVPSVHLSPHEDERHRRVLSHRPYGVSSDVVADRRQMDYTVISSGVSEITWRVDLRNHKEQGVEVTLVESVGGDWEIHSSTHLFAQTDAWTFTLLPLVEVNGETVVEYRVGV